MVKVISLSEPAYQLLKSHKQEGMSFSDVIMFKFNERQTEKSETIADLLKWIERQPKGKEKVKYSSQIDEILYGA